MAKLNLSQAAKVVGRNRTTIWRHIKSGRLSSSKDKDGMPIVDTSELLRVYGELKKAATHTANKKQHPATPEYSVLIETIEKLRLEQIEMKTQIAELSNRLQYTPVSESTKPEEDPLWPSEVKTLADIALRFEIKEKYNKQKK